MFTSIETKICSKCERELTLDDFNKNSRAKDGKSKVCKDCTNLYARNWTKKAKLKKPIKKEVKVKSSTNRSGSFYKRACRNNRAQVIEAGYKMNSRGELFN